MKKNIKAISEKPENYYEISDEDIGNVVGGVGLDLTPVLQNRVGKPGSTTVLSCPVCGLGEEKFSVLSVAELKYKCPCGATLQYNKTRRCFCQV